MHDLIANELHKVLEEMRHESKTQTRILHEILHELQRSRTANRVLGGVIAQKGNPNMIDIAPGNSPVFSAASAHLN